ncbi:hypothetical protein [Geomonas agri]|uniref:hypothetical protein n=1 Tax=Geomonas agri TaxID=2873702 RepID=UPI001CD4D0FA|nr:hypothetical protein [Geomonas agri]
MGFLKNMTIKSTAKSLINGVYQELIKANIGLSYCYEDYTLPIFLERRYKRIFGEEPEEQEVNENFKRRAFYLLCKMVMVKTFEELSFNNTVGSIQDQKLVIETVASHWPLFRTVKADLIKLESRL